MIVFDTNVISELMRPERSQDVVSFVDRHDSDDVYTTSITVAEIGAGLSVLERGDRRTRLASIADTIFDAFANRILVFDVPAAHRYAAVVSRRQAIGRPIPVADAMIAAICLEHGSQLATRNVKDFAEIGIDIVNPWVA